MTPIHAVEPDLRYGANRAWKFDVEAAAKAAGRDNSMFLGSWIVYQKDKVLAQVSVTRLQSEEPRFVQGATHDISVLHLDPDWGAKVDSPNQPLPDVPFVGQFLARDDADAKDRLVLAVMGLLHDKLTTGADGRAGWYEQFGGETYEALLAEAKRRNEEHVAQLQAALQNVDPNNPRGITPGCDCEYCTAARVTQ